MIEPPYGIPDDAEIEKERQRRKNADAPPLPNPFPATAAELLAECKKHRALLVAAMQGGGFTGPLTGFPKALFIPPVERLWQAAAALDIPGVPPFPDKPVTALECVAALDSLIQWCRSKQLSTPGSSQPAHEEPPVKSKRGGGSKLLEERNLAQSNLYKIICKEHVKGQRKAYTAELLKQRRDIRTLAQKAGIPLNRDTVLKALEWERQRLNNNRQAPMNNETDGSPLYDSDD